MKLSISSFTIALIAGLVLLMLTLWSGSLMLVLEQQNRQAAKEFQQNWQTQVEQLQQKQQLWLQSQYYLLTSLAESPAEQQNFQSFVWDYYQRNPTIWAVNLVHFDQQGHPVSKTSKPGCLQPLQMRLRDFSDILEPSFTSCRIDDKALLEIAGPVRVDGNPAVLLVSMDYFSFLREFSNLSYRNLNRAADTDEGIQYEEYGLANERDRRITIPVGDKSAVFGQLHLSLHTPSSWQVFRSQALILIAVMLLAAAVVLVLLYFNLIAPLRSLAQRMRFATASQQDLSASAVPRVMPGLKLLEQYFGDLQSMAKRDPVTGLNNRIIFEDRLAQAIREGKRSARKYALVMIDVPGLEAIAHKSGQYIADALLRLVGESLRQGLRESDNLARFERNLFALLLEVQERDQLESLVEKIYLSVTRHYQVHGREFDLSAVIGVAIYPDHALDADDLYQHASDALVAAENSEWPIKFFRENDDTDTSGFSLIQALRRAIERDELKLVFQPVVDLQSYDTIYFEALLRWKDPGRHEFSIDRTIRLAERNHLIKPLTNWIIETACRFISQSDVAGLVVGINLSMIDLHDRQLPQRIETCLHRYQVKPAQIVIEITEGQIMQDPAEVVDVLAHLGVMGLSLSIDDFGTGQASLTYLKELPVEKLKIDQSFVRDIASNPDDQLIVKATIELAHTLDLKVVAEGVETLAVYRLLEDMNCDHAQGYYISHPLEAEQVSDWFATSVKPDLVRRDR